LSQFDDAQAKRDHILRVVAALHKELGFFPTLRQLADRTGMPRTLLQYHLNRLIADGLIAIEASTATVPCRRVVLLAGHAQAAS
jgi:DNA-binding MarR family transcriptional regulator